MLKAYSVSLEYSDWIEIEAESEDEALDAARDSVYHGDIKARVVEVRCADGCECDKCSDGE